MNKKLFFPLALVPPAATSLQAQKSVQTQCVDKRPNIILFMINDMGWQGAPLPFWIQKADYNKLHETPSIERLARQDMTFTQAYASSISSPAQCSLITGTDATRHRVTNWTLQKNTKTGRKDKTLGMSDWNYNGISQVPSTNSTFVGISFVQLLGDSGYHTIHYGKAHFGAVDTPGENPHHWGFEVNVAGHAAGGFASYPGGESYGHNRDRKPVSLMIVSGLEKYRGTEVFVTEVLTLEAIKALNKTKKYNQSFYLRMSQYAIHVPLGENKRFYDKYKKKGMTDHEVAYAILIEGINRGPGDLMDWLGGSGEADNIITIFVSDNGGFAAGSYQRDGKLYTQNRPLNSSKGPTYEGGIHEPMIVNWPDTIAPNGGCSDYLLIEDFYPTTLETAGVKKYKTAQPIDGISFMLSLKQTRNPSKGYSLFWNMPNNWGNSNPETNFNCAVRKGDWELIYCYDTGKKELFNIPGDISKSNDLDAQYPDTVKRLPKELGTYLRKVDAQHPTVKTTGKPCLWPDEVE